MTLKKFFSCFFLRLMIFALSLRLILAGIGLFLPDIFPFGITDILFGVFIAISVIAFLVFSLGDMNDPEKKVIRTLLAVCLKTLLTFILALVLFFGLKMRNVGIVILFFILYLGFTLFLVFSMLNTIKKSH